MDDPNFRRGLKRLPAHNLTFEAWIYHPQIKALTEVARECPDVRIVLNHFGGPLGVCAVTRRRFPVGASPTRRFAPAGSNRSSHGGNEMAEAFETGSQLGARAGGGAAPRAK